MTSSLSDLYLQRLARKQHIAALLHTDPDDPNDSCNQNEWISSLMYPNQIKEAIIEGSGGDAAGSTAEEGAHNLRRHNFHTRREKRSRQQQDDSGETAPASAVAAPGALLATKKVSPILRCLPLKRAATTVVLDPLTPLLIRPYEQQHVLIGTTERFLVVVISRRRDRLAVTVVTPS